VRTFVFGDYPEVHVDFNSMSHGRWRVSATLNPDGWDRIQQDRWVRAGDGEGNFCLARVVDVHEDVGHLEPFWESWTPSGDEMIVITSAEVDLLNDGVPGHPVNEVVSSGADPVAWDPQPQEWVEQVLQPA